MGESGEALQKRFELPKDEQIRERLVSFQNAISSLQESNPEVVGATVYGSMVTGSAKETSDIDGFVFIDAKRAKGNLTDEDWQRAKREAEKQEGIDEIDLAVINHYQVVVDKSLEAANLTEHQAKGIRVRAISDEIIMRELDQAVESEKQIR